MHTQLPSNGQGIFGFGLRVTCYDTGVGKKGRGQGSGFGGQRSGGQSATKIGG